MSSYYDDATVEHVERMTCTLPGNVRAILDALATAPGWSIEYDEWETGHSEGDLSRCLEPPSIVAVSRLVGPWCGGERR